MRSLGFVVEVFATLETIPKCIELITPEKKNPESLAPLTCQLNLDSNPVAKPKIKSLFPGSCSAVSSLRATNQLSIASHLVGKFTKKAYDPKLYSYWTLQVILRQKLRIALRRLYSFPFLMPTTRCLSPWLVTLPRSDFNTTWLISHYTLGLYRILFFPLWSKQLLCMSWHEMVPPSAKSWNKRDMIYSSRKY